MRESRWLPFFLRMRVCSQPERTRIVFLLSGWGAAGMIWDSLDNLEKLDNLDILEKLDNLDNLDNP